MSLEAEAGDSRAAAMKPALLSGLTLHEPELQVSAPSELVRIHPDKLAVSKFCHNFAFADICERQLK